MEETVLLQPCKPIQMLSHQHSLSVCKLLVICKGQVEVVFLSPKMWILMSFGLHHVHLLLSLLSLILYSQALGLFLNSSAEMCYTSNMFINPVSENVGLENSSIGDCIDKAVVLEPTPLAVLPPEPLISKEELENEVNLMMVDSMDSMDADPPSTHDLAQ